jgi:dihydrofolate reductase
MGTLTVAMFMTIDGITETPDGSLISPAWSGDLQQHWSGGNAHEGQLLMYGRRAFEFNAAHWPDAEADPGNPEDYRSFARTINGLPKVVVSSSLTDVGWNARVETGPITEVAKRVTSSFDGEVVAVGGMGLVASLIGAGAVDRYRFLVMPQIAGQGRSIFDDLDVGAKLELISNQTMDTGALLLDYRPC